MSEEWREIGTGKERDGVDMKMLLVFSRVDFFSGPWDSLEGPRFSG